MGTALDALWSNIVLGGIGISTALLIAATAYWLYGETLNRRAESQRKMGTRSPIEVRDIRGGR